MRFTRDTLFLTLTSVLLSINIYAKDNAVIMLYHHVSNTTPSATSVSPEIFRQHMQYLADNHQILPLQEVVERLQQSEPLPEKSVVITFDDGYKNIFENAHPILKEFNFPYTVFINPPLIGTMDYQLDWQQIKTMAKEKASFANHGSEHQHMLFRVDDESDKTWLKRLMNDIKQAEATLQEKLGYSLKYFAYPYGEFDNKLKESLRKNGYVGFAQHSGAIASHSDFMALPRYPAAGIYSNLSTLKVKLNSLAMPVSHIQPADPKFILNAAQPNMTFTVNSDDFSTSQITCFQDGQPLQTKVKESNVQVAIIPIQKAGRHRVNCTAMSQSTRGRYYWFSQPFFVPTEQGAWLD